MAARIGRIRIYCNRGDRCDSFDSKKFCNRSKTLPGTGSGDVLCSVVWEMCHDEAYSRADGKKIL